MQAALRRSERWGRDEHRAYQATKLLALIAHARAHVPYYRERDFSLPITRRTLQEHGAELVAAEVPKGHGALSTATSGGSSGVPVTVQKTGLADLWWNALQVRDELWHRQDPTGAIVRLRRSPPDLTPEQVALVGSPEGLLFPDYGPPTSALWRTGRVGVMDDRVAVEHQAAYIARLEPKYLFTFPSNLRLLLAHLRGTRAPKLESVWTMSEAVDDELRARCREVFGCKIVHNYSCAEAGYLALQCPETDAFHVMSEAVVLEVLSDDGRPAGPGETGKVVITPLWNYAQPLIRYELGDRVELGEPCSCGRGLPVLKRIVGRESDYVVTPDGVKRPVDQGFYKLSAIEAVREFQIAQVASGCIEARLVLSGALSSKVSAAVHQVLFDEFGPGFSFSISARKSIERTAAGKLRAFVQEAT